MRESVEGSITIEAAITLPIFLLVLTLLIRMIQTHEAEILWKGAVERTVEEASLIYSGLSPDDERIKSDLGLSISGSGLIHSFVLNQRQESWYNDLTREKPHIRSLVQTSFMFIEQHDSGYYDWHTTYSINIGPFHTLRVYNTAIPVWRSQESTDVEEEDEDDTEELIWEASNFARGLYFREKYGGNLPTTFRVISGFSNGEARLIKSIDLTAPTWQNANSLEKEVRTQIERLQGYQPNSKERDILGSANIAYRRLIIVIPTNSPDSGKQILYGLKQHAEYCGIILEVNADSTSHRYS